MSESMPRQGKPAAGISPALVGTGLLQRKCACGQHTLGGGECEECRKKPKGSLQRAATSSSVIGEAPPIVHEVLRSPGRPLDGAVRDSLEPQFGRNFSRVRIHSDALAADSARAVGALAYTVGQDVVFAEGRYQPAGREGRGLLAHELAHTLQQGDARPAGALAIAAPDHPGEVEASRAANAVGPAGALAAASMGLFLQRQPAPSASAAPPAASPPTPTQIYQQAVPKVKPLDPTIFTLLSKASLGTGPQLVLSETTQGPPGTQPIIIEVKLDVQLDALPANKDAEMQTAVKGIPDPAAKKFELTGTMKVNSTMPQGTTSDALAQVLVHEGTHFQIAVDKLVSPQNQSAYAGSFGKYLTTAQTLRGPLLAQLDLYMEAVLKKHNKPTDPTARFKDARKVVDLIVEEKYVYDQDKKRFGAARSNLSIAKDYIIDGLNAIGILPAANIQPDLGNLITQAKKFLDDLDAQLNPPPAPSQPAPSGSGSGKPSTPP